jgi:hypothetical protein
VPHEFLDAGDRRIGIEQIVRIGWKGGALSSCEDTFPPSPLRTGRATHRCIRLSNIGHTQKNTELSSLTVTSNTRSNTFVGLVLLDGYVSGPSPCTWLSHVPWVDVTPPTTTTSLSHLSRCVPSPSALIRARIDGSSVAVWLLEWGGVGFRTRSP